MNNTGRRFSHVPSGSGATYDVIGEQITFKTTQAETNGAYTTVELIARPGGGPPLHTHPSCETFTILEGELEFIGLDNGVQYAIRAVPGDTVFIPGGDAHAYRVIGETPVRTTIVFAPGSDMEGFFSEVGIPVDAQTSPNGSAPDMGALLAIGAKHGLEFLIPSPAD